MALDPAELQAAGLRLEITTPGLAAPAQAARPKVASPKVASTEAARAWQDSMDGAGDGPGIAGADGTAGTDGTVATVTLNRPRRRNAMTPSMWRGLAAVGRALPASVRVVVIRGEGPSFCAGIDLRLFSPEGVPGEEALPDARSEAFESWIGQCQAGFTWLRRPDIVSIAAVRGHAIGAGFQLALSCDLRVFADDASVCMKEPALGLVPDLTGTKVLTDLVGVPRALEICLTTRTVDATEARELRLAELVVPGAELDAAVSELVAALLAIDPETARATKRLIQLAPANTLEEQAAAEARIQTELQRAKSAG
jgi:enoyl-CoA hydratase/carnithine racemase